MRSVGTVSTDPVDGTDRIDRVGRGGDGGAVAWLRRRLTGRYPVDPFGADPTFEDVVSAGLERFLRVTVEGSDVVPEAGPGVLVVEPGRIGDAVAVAVGVRRAVGRRVRVVGYPDAPLLGATLRRLGFVRERADDLAAVLRAGHLALVRSTSAALEGAPDAPVLTAVNDLRPLFLAANCRICRRSAAENEG